MSTIVPTIDLSPFMPGGDESLRKDVMDSIYEACTNLGAFFIENHGMPIDKYEKLLDMTDTFLGSSEEEEKKSTEEDLKEFGDGYGEVQDKYHDFEYKRVYDIFSTIYNDSYRNTFEDVFISFAKTAKLLEEIINDCLGLPPDIRTTYNDNQNWDHTNSLMIPMYYTRENMLKYHTQENKFEKIGNDKHDDSPFTTITIQNKFSRFQLIEDKNPQNHVYCLKLREDKDWIPSFPTTHQMLVGVGDLAQVLRNKKITGLKSEKTSRFAIDFCYNFGPDKFREPLRLLPEEIGIKQKYRGFVYKDYIDLGVEDYDITYYNI